MLSIFNLHFFCIFPVLFLLVSSVFSISFHYSPFFHISEICSLFDLPFFHIFHTISHFNLLFLHIFHITSLFNFAFFYIVHIISQFSSVFSISYY
jgi:hypothetical protein